MKKSGKASTPMIRLITFLYTAYVLTGMVYFLITSRDHIAITDHDRRVY